MLEHIGQRLAATQPGVNVVSMDTSKGVDLFKNITGNFGDFLKKMAPQIALVLAIGIALTFAVKYAKKFIR